MNNGSEVKVLNLEELINNIFDVVSSKVVMNGDEIEEIHVLASNRRGPKQISRDIQSALNAKFNMNIDYKKISVAQIDDKHSYTNEFRLQVESVQLSITGNITEIKVVLVKDNEKIEGIAKGLGSKNNSYRLVAQATIDCIHKILNVEDILIVEDVEKIYLAKEQIMIVAVSYISNRSETLMTGTAIIVKDEYETIVKATLDAINRRISKISNLS
ncbi:hypothetical protein [Serpentinicella alkaliphila]|uniref:Uncharacterized protein n=1 Tax=Serpentinicella alkaliphila TaxID=1734049 RepID=A0A4R2TME0_9FIRM|nr:hypothetical protein [Serpentinicella alkaliphila]QUH24703.1 hypothetical protein HZR23_02105 [Serpentinicella alkaliphila]TCQ03692.1 hypothetical protein EDD79_10087 [Serpentinicella alkaliphila]